MLVVLVVLSLVVYRVTRFLIDDLLIERQRDWLKKRILRSAPEKIPTWQGKLVDLLECPYCLSVWIAAAVVALASWTWSVPQPFWSWLAVCGATMAWWKLIED